MNKNCPESLAQEVVEWCRLRKQRQRFPVNHVECSVEYVAEWLYRSATRVTLDRIRQKTRNEPREYSGEFDALNLADTSSPPALKVIEQREMSACVHDYINKLADGYRA